MSLNQIVICFDEATSEQNLITGTMKTMKPMKLNISFSQLIAEFFIVFVGVAIALAADDWRGDREERNRELAYLLAIDADMKSASDVLETALSDNNEFARNSSAALAVLRSTEPPSPESTAKFNLGLNFSVSEPAVPIGTIRALLESGELSIILSDELRATLISELAEIERNLSWISRVADQALPNIRIVNVEFEAQRLKYGTVDETALFNAYRETPQLLVGFVTHLRLLNNIITSINSVNAAVVNIQEAVTAELAVRGKAVGPEGS